MSAARRPEDTWATGAAAIASVAAGLCPVCHGEPSRPACHGAMAAVALGAVIRR